MTINEFQCRKDQGKGKVLIKVLKHKTSASTGPANIIINKMCEEAMSRYHNSIRTKIAGQNAALNKLFFKQVLAIPLKKYLKPCTESCRGLFYQRPNCLTAPEGYEDGSTL